MSEQSAPQPPEMPQAQVQPEPQPQPQPQPAYQPQYQQAPQPQYQQAPQPQYCAAPAPRFIVDGLTGGEKAFDIILSIFFPFIVPICMWFSWRICAPQKANKAMLYGMITSGVVVALNLIIYITFMSVIIASISSLSSLSGTMY